MTKQKILLLAPGSKWSNLALMQISTYHKAKGDIVGLNILKPDIVYVSIIFNKDHNKASEIQAEYPNAKVYIGGSGYSYNKLPRSIQRLKPDYTLYPDCDYSLGFTTRGCIRNCKFCIVREKEGTFHRWQHISQFHNPNFKMVKLLDNNIFADKDWFFENTDYILDNKLKIDITQGMDIRLLDKEIAQRLKELKWGATLRFAFDSLSDEKAVLQGINLLKEVRINVRSNVQFYVLVGFNTTPEEDIYRCRLLKKHNTNAFVMQYTKDRLTKRLARWANRKWLYWKIDIDEYIG